MRSRTPCQPELFFAIGYFNPCSQVTGDKGPTSKTGEWWCEKGSLSPSDCEGSAAHRARHLHWVASRRLLQSGAIAQLSFMPSLISIQEQNSNLDHVQKRHLCAFERRRGGKSAKPALEPENQQQCSKRLQQCMHRGNCPWPQTLRHGGAGGSCAAPCARGRGWWRLG